VPLPIEQRSGYIHVSGDGLYSLLEAQQHFRDLSDLIGRQRRRGIGVRVMVDLRTGAPQTKEVTEHIQKATRVIYREEDRLALIVQSALLKMQVQRLHTREGTQVFVSEGAALEYLTRHRLVQQTTIEADRG
jgi:hypothetical protein